MASGSKPSDTEEHTPASRKVRHQPSYLKRAERESILIFNDADSTAIVSTTSPVVARRWRARGVPLVESNGSWRAVVPKSCVRVSVVPRRRPNAGSFGRRERSAECDAGLEAAAR